MLYNRSNRIENLKFRRDLTNDLTEYNLNSTIVDFAIRLEYVEASVYPEIAKNLDQYAYLTLIQGHY